MPPEPAVTAGPVGDALIVWLDEAQRRGLVGPGPTAPLVEHSLGFADVAEDVIGAVPDEVIDLGSGGGIPGLVLAARWPATRVTLAEGAERRGQFLDEAIWGLGWAVFGHVRVVTRRVEELGRDSTWRERSGLVVARSFGPPPVTAECGAPLIRIEGWLVVSEPPASADTAARWPEAGLAQLGLEPRGVIRRRGFGYQALRKVHVTPPRYPRRVGIPAKRPLY
jgi:16S rRNA (guanine527-N7)-methyltransferase